MLEVERWVGALVLYVTYASDERPAFGLAAYRSPTDRLTPTPGTVRRMAAIELDAIEQRVIGSLLEKERTVPDSYPMTLNAVRTACNQTSGREPVMALGDFEVQGALDRLRAQGLTRSSTRATAPARRSTARCSTRCSGSTPRSGRSSPCSSCAARRRRASCARGPSGSTTSTRSTRCSRPSTCSSVRDEPLAEELGRQPGQKETRWVHRLGPVEDATQAHRRRRTTSAFPTGPSA